MIGLVIASGTAFIVGAIWMERKQPPAIRDIESERERHIDLGHSFAKDAELTDGELLKMASAYMHPLDAYEWWPYDEEPPISLRSPGVTTMPADVHRRNLVKAASLIVAEIDRMDHAARQPKQRLSERQFQLIWLVALVGLGLLAAGGGL